MKDIPQDMAEPRLKLFKFITAKFFFQTYAPGVTNVKHKLRGVDGNKKPIDFTEKEKREIEKGVDRLCRDLKKWIPK